MTENEKIEGIQNILETDLNEDQIKTFLHTASNLVERAVKSVEESTKNDIIIWLTAHFIASTREQQLTRAKAGTAEAVFQGKTGLGLDSTFYGQHVKMLDTSGVLSRLDKDTAEAYIYAVPSERK